MDTDDATGRGSRAAAPDAVGPIRVDAEPLHYEPALDGIRAVAVLAVMAFHFLGAEYFAGGLIGVDVFFVLSGFLITSLLLDEQNRTGAVSLRGFYHRRVLRLFPAMYTLLGLVAVAAIFIGAEYPSVWAELGAAALYSYQIFLGLFGFATPDSPRVLFHLWSLSVEEWFYFFWPFLLLLGLRSRARQRTLIAAASAGAGFWVLVRLSGEAVGVNWTHDDPFVGTGVTYVGEVLYRFSAMRFDQLLVGCLLAVVVRRGGAGHARAGGRAPARRPRRRLRPVRQHRVQPGARRHPFRGAVDPPEPPGRPGPVAVAPAGGVDRQARLRAVPLARGAQHPHPQARGHGGPAGATGGPGRRQHGRRRAVLAVHRVAVPTPQVGPVRRPAPGPHRTGRAVGDDGLTRIRRFPARPGALSPAV